MGILATIERRATIEDPTVPLSGATAMLLDAWGGARTQAGVQVSEQRALTFGAVWACVDLISGIMSSLPLDLMEKTEPRGRRPKVEDSRYRVLRWKANPEIESNILIKVLQAHKLTWGNAYAEKQINGAGELVALWPLLPDRTCCERIDGERWYFTRVREKSGIEKKVALPASKVLHVPGLGFDGLKGYSVIGMAMRMAIAVGMAADEYAARFYGSGMLTSGVLSHPQTLSPEAQNRLRTEFEQRNQGLSMAHRMMVLEEGLKWEKTGIAPDEAQFLDSRLFQRREVAGMYHVPPDMIGDLEHPGGYNSGEQRALVFRQQCLRVHGVDWERALGGSLLTDEERSRLYFTFNFAELERADLKTTIAALTEGRNAGLFSANDCREKLDENPIGPQGDVYLVPLNMIPADQVMKPAAGAGGDDTTTKAARAAALDTLLGRLQRSYRDLFAAALGRVVRREAKALRAALDVAADGAEFVRLAQDYYGGPFRRHAEADLLPVVQTLARYLREEVVGIYGETRVEASAAAGAVTSDLLDRHLTASHDAIRSSIAASEIDAMLARWESERSDRAADAETPAVCAALAARFHEEI